MGHVFSSAQRSPQPAPWKSNAPYFRNPGIIHIATASQSLRRSSWTCPTHPARVGKGNGRVLFTWLRQSARSVAHAGSARMHGSATRARPEAVRRECAWAVAVTTAGSSGSVDGRDPEAAIERSDGWIVGTAESIQAADATQAARRTDGYAQNEIVFRVIRDPPHWLPTSSVRSASTSS